MHRPNICGFRDFPMFLIQILSEAQSTRFISDNWFTCFFVNCVNELNGFHPMLKNKLILRTSTTFR